jgi:hypothetical protein
VDLLQAIESILRPAIVHPGPIVLSEGDPGSRCKPITIKRAGRAVVIRPDSIDCAGLPMNDRLFPWFDIKSPGVTRLCDYIVFYRAPSQARLFVFLCELKSGSRQGYTAQVASGRLLADYLIAMSKHHCGVTENPEIHYRALVFSADQRSPKGSAKPGNFRYHGKLPKMESVCVAYLRGGITYELIGFCD